MLSVLAWDPAALRARCRSARGLVAHLSRLARGRGAVSLIDQMIVSGTTFTTSVVIGRLLSRESLGVYFLGWNLVLLARSIQGDLITSPYMMYHRRHDPHVAPYYTGSVILHEVLFALLVGLVIASLAGGGLIFNPDRYGAAAWALAAVMPLMLLREFVRNVSFAHLKLGAVVVTDALIALLQIGGLVTLYLLGSLSIASAYMAVAFACGLATLLWWWQSGPQFQIGIRAALRDWRMNWRFGRWALAGQLSGRAASFALPWIIALIHGEAATGVFAACTTLVNLAGTYVTGISNYLTPCAAEAFAEQSASGLVIVLRRFALLYTVTVGCFAIAMTFCGGFLASLVFGPAYAGQSTVITLLAFAMLFNSLSITAGNGLWVLDRPRANFLADIASLAVSFVTLPLLLWRYEIAGAAASQLCASVVGMLLRTWVLRSELVPLLAASVRPEHA